MREYILVFLVSATVTFLVTPLTRRLAVRIGAMASPRDRDVHVIPSSEQTLELKVESLDGSAPPHEQERVLLHMPIDVRSGAMIVMASLLSLYALRWAEERTPASDRLRRIFQGGLRKQGKQGRANFRRLQSGKRYGLRRHLHCDR